MGIEDKLTNKKLHIVPNRIKQGHNIKKIEHLKEILIQLLTELKIIIIKKIKPFDLL